jgi:hypothetical protein
MGLAGQNYTLRPLSSVGALSVLKALQKLIARRLLMHQSSF